MRLRLALLALGVIGCTPAVAAADDHSIFSPDRFALGATAGSDGVGGELEYSLNRFIVVRGRGTWLEFDYGANASAVHYSANVKLSQGGGFIDVHPFANPFVVTLGGIAGPRRADVSFRFRDSLKIDGVTFTAAQLGSGAGDASIGTPAPMVGVGYDNSFTHSGHWGFKFTAGVVFGHAPDLTLSPKTGLAAQDQALIQGYLDEAERDVHRDGDVLAYFPQVSAGVTYRF